MSPQTLPHSLDLERTVLAAALYFAGDHLPTLLDTCRAEDFYGPQHRALFELFSAAHARREAVEPIAIRLRADRALVELIDTLPTPLLPDITALCDDLALLGRNRRVTEACGQLYARGLASTRDPAEFRDESTKILAEVSAEGSARMALTGASQLSAELLADLDNPNAATTFVPTGLRDIDNSIGGWEPGCLYVVAGRPGMGKSALAFQCLAYAAKQGHPGIGFSLEMRKERVFQRLVAGETGLNSKVLDRGARRASDMPKIVRAVQTLEALPFWLADDPNLTVQQLRAVCRKARATHGLKLIVLDYLQLMSAGGKHESREQEISHMSRELKKLAGELDIAVIALSQLNRMAETRRDNRPMLSDLRESGAIEQDADTVLLMYREDYYDEQSQRKNICDIIAAKNRHGDTGFVSVLFLRESSSFRSFAPYAVET